MTSQIDGAEQSPFVIPSPPEDAHIVGDPMTMATEPNEAESCKVELEVGSLCIADKNSPLPQVESAADVAVADDTKVDETPPWCACGPLLLRTRQNTLLNIVYVIYHAIVFSMPVLFFARRCVSHVVDTKLPWGHCNLRDRFQTAAVPFVAIGGLSPIIFVITMTIAFIRGGFTLEGPPTGALMNLLTYNTISLCLAATGFLVPALVQLLFTLGTFFIPHVLGIPPFPTKLAQLLFIVSQNVDEWQTIGDLATAYSLAANGIGISYMLFAWLRQLLQGVLSIFTKLPYFQDEQARRYFLGVEIAANCCKLPLLILDCILIFRYPSEIQNASGGIIYFAASIKLVGLVTNIFSSGKKVKLILCGSGVDARVTDLHGTGEAGPATDGLFTAEIRREQRSPLDGGIHEAQEADGVESHSNTDG